MGELRDQMEPENYLVRHGMSVLKAGMELNRCAGGTKNQLPVFSSEENLIPGANIYDVREGRINSFNRF